MTDEKHEKLIAIYDKLQYDGLLQESIKLESEELEEIQKYLKNMVAEIYDFRTQKTAEIEEANRHKELEKIQKKIPMGPTLRKDEVAAILNITDKIQKRRHRIHVISGEKPEVPEEMELVKDEINTRKINYTEYIEYARHYSIPISKAPGLAMDALAYLEENGLAGENFKRIYHSQKDGYIAVLSEKLMPREDQYFYEERLADDLNGWGDPI